MAVDEVQLMNHLKGKRIKITLKTSSYTGIVQRINSNKTLVLVEVVNASNGSKYPGSKLFFGREILNVEFTDEADVGSGRTHDPEDQLTLRKYGMTIDGDGEENIDFEVIDEIHKKFWSAVMHIKKQRVIGVGADGVETFLHGRLCWLQIALKKKVYLFDIKLLGARAFKNGLAVILADKDILKVMHDCRAIAGCLISQFGVKLTYVFDTQVADVMCFYSDTGGFLPDRVCTLHEVVSLHLKLPPSQILSLKMKSQLTQQEKEIWYKRPCPVTLQKIMALSVIHLQPLRLVLLDTMMNDYVTLVTSYLESSHYEPDDLEHLGMESVLQLPRELLQLQRMHHERQEWAKSHYPVTEHGLLARFKPRIKSPSHTSPAHEEDTQTVTESVIPPHVKSPSSGNLNPLTSQQPTSPPKVSSVSSSDAQTLSDLVAQPPVTAKTSDLGKEIPPLSPMPVGIARGHREVLNTIGRGMPVEKEQSALNALPAIGRGFLLQMTPAQILRESGRNVKSPGSKAITPSFPNLTPPQWVFSQPGSAATDLPKHTCGGWL